MNINDPEKLIPIQSLIIDVINTHPFYNKLSEQINDIDIEEATQEQYTGIIFDLDSHDIILRIEKEAYKQNNFLHVLYHEFGHVADKLNSSFLFSTERNMALSGKERDILNEIWNIYIDSRLNSKGLFQLCENEIPICGSINGKHKTFEHNINGRLEKHISFLESRGISQAEKLVHEIWNNPNKLISYSDIICIIVGVNEINLCKRGRVRKTV